MVQPARNLDDAWIAVDAFPLIPGDSRYVDCSEVRGNTLLQIERMLERHMRAKRYLHLLFTGYRGNGKTTELYQLQSNIKNNYEVIYFDAAMELDVNNLSLSDLLLTIAKEIIESMREKGYTLPEELLEKIGDWFFEKILEKSTVIAKEAGGKADIGIPKWVSFITAKVFSTIKIKTDERETVRRKLERDITDLINQVNALLISARSEVQRQGKKDLLFIMDSLDRLRSGLDKNLFMGTGTFLKQLKGNFIYVVPISLLYDEQARLLPFDEDIKLPMISIYERGIERYLDTTSFKYLKEIITKRVVPEAVFSHPEATIEELILASGGHLRDLMKLITYSCNEADQKITPSHAKLAINKLIEDYKRVVREEDYEHIVIAYKTQDPPNNEINQKLIYNNVILVYSNFDGKEWKDVHPSVVKNNKFQELINKG